MDETLLLTSIALFTLLAGVCSIIFNKAKLPPLIGYLTAGIVIANAFTVDETGMSAIEILSDFGLVLLMFCIGLEINLKKIRKQGSFAILVVITQLPLTVLFGTIAGNIMGFDAIQSIVLGTVLSGCSTAAVMSVMTSQKTFSKEHINTIVLIIIMQDIGQVIMLSILTPVLAGSTMEVSGLVVLITSIAIFMVASIAIGLRYIPTLINKIADNVPSEILIVFSVGLAFFMAWLATIAGLSMAIGAFIMGLLMSSARNSESINSSVEPMKNLFMAMFFISVGMEVSIDSLSQNIPTILLFYGLFAFCMFVAVNTGYWVANGDSRSGWISAMAMCTMGEFAFIISKQALDFGVFDQSFYSSIIGAAILSMIILPVLVRTSEKTYNGAARICPGFIKRAGAFASGERDMLYHGLNVASHKSKENFSKALTNSVFLVILIVMIEIVFFFSYDPLSEWLTNNYGADEYTWRIVILFANIIILMEPCRRLAKFMRFALYLMQKGKDHLDRSPSGPRAPVVYEYFSTLAVGAAMTVIIVILVPNGISSLIHVLVLLVVLAGTVLFQFFRYRKKVSAAENGESDTTEVPEQAIKDGAEEAPETESEGPQKEE